MRPFAEPRFSENPRTALAPLFEDPADVVLAADTIARIPIPIGARFVVFSFDGDVRAKLGVVGTTFTLPSATSLDGAGSILNPTARRLPSFLADGETVPTHVCLRAPAACTGSLSFFG